MIKPEVPYYCSPLYLTMSPTGSSEQGYVFEITFRASDSESFELSKAFVTYILKIAVCTRCLETIGEEQHLRTCDKTARSVSPWSTARDRFCFLTSHQVAEFRKRWSREKARFRKYKLRKIPKPSDEILLELRNQQGNRCYYCFVEFDSFGVNTFELDHFDSVAHGGSNSIFNLVYACATCNKEKFTENGAEFLNRCVPKTDANDEIRRMRRSVARWKKRFAPKNLADVKRLVYEHGRRIPRNDPIEFDEWCREGRNLLLRLEQVRREIK